NLHFLEGFSILELPDWKFEESNVDVELTYYITHYQKSLIRFLIEESPVFSIPRQQPSWMAGRLTIQEERFYRNYVWARYYFLFGHHELAEVAAREANENRKLQEGSPLVPANLAIWFLSITQNWHHYTGPKAKELTILLQEILDSFKMWKDNAPSNYLATWSLLCAEWARIEGDFKLAENGYLKSLDAAGHNKYHAAMANELFARYWLSLPGKRQVAVSY